MTPSDRDDANIMQHARVHSFVESRMKFLIKDLAAQHLKRCT